MDLVACPIYWIHLVPLRVYPMGQLKQFPLLT